MPKEPLPTYADLLSRTDGPSGSTWGLFGEDDQLGTLNLLRLGSLAEAAAEVRAGTAFSLNLRSDVIDPSLAPTREPAVHHIFQRTPFHHDEWLDRYFTQYSSQLDGLRHIAHPDHGFYNAADAKRFTPDDDLMGMIHLSSLPIAGRGVLLDIGRYLEQIGEPLDCVAGTAVSRDVLDAALAAQGTQLHRGDILLIRFGWLQWYQAVATPHMRAQLVERQVHPGLAQSHDIVGWLWDHHISLVAADNFALECWPAAADSPFYSNDEQRQDHHDDPHAGIMHRALIGLLGMPIGELWDLDALAEACAADCRWSFLLTVAPLPLVGGVGSPANAIALR